MIVSASYRTDIPAFYGSWFMSRLEAGFCRVASPYGGTPYRVSLRRGDVDGFVFWTRNVEPFLAALDEIRRRGFPFVVQFTATGYPTALERSVIDGSRAIEQVRALAARFGPKAVVWRYDPIVVSDITPLDWHRGNFARLARMLEGSIDEVVMSFAQIYRKTKRNLDAAARAHGFGWRDPSDEEKLALVATLVERAAAHGMRLSLCAQPTYRVPGAAEARCVDAARLSEVAGYSVGAATKGNRPGCLCAESRDIGAYDTCPHACVYCYAVGSRAVALARHRAHDAANECLDARARGVLAQTV